MKYFLLFFIFLPIIEIYFFVKIGSEIGAASTILFTLLTAFIGAATMKYVGVSSFNQARKSMLHVKPGLEILDPLTLYVCGVFLLIPGFFTDFLGILLFLPPLRLYLIKFFLNKAFSNLRGAPQNKSKSKDYIDIDPNN
ncbi:MAG: FxsA family protein [Gammaproteobacteria bacterium]|jgi:UPF0716 protein FxsA|nr:FxsA family protein [Gammaproteobacteria bacterium]MBT7603595.1 FxsA family protein [Gammaproteobacteria bacterium]